jgi:hypothetical protein
MTAALLFSSNHQQVAQDLTKESRQKVLLLQHRAHTLMDEKKKLRAQTEQSDANAALKWKDAEQRMEGVEVRMEDIKKLLATETMLRKKADKTVKFLRAQLIQAKKDVDAKESIIAAKVKSETNSRPASVASRPTSGSSQRSSVSEAASSESEISSAKSGSQRR